MVLTWFDLLLPSLSLYLVQVLAAAHVSLMHVARIFASVRRGAVPLAVTTALVHAAAFESFRMLAVAPSSSVAVSVPAEVGPSAVAAVVAAVPSAGLDGPTAFHFRAGFAHE